MYLITGSLYLWPPSWPIYSFPTSGNHKSDLLFLWGLFLFLFLYSSCTWGQTIFIWLWLISLHIRLSRSIHIVPNVSISFFLWMNNIPLHKYVPLLYLFILQWTLRWLPCLGYYSDAMNMGLQISLWHGVFIYFRYIPRSRIAGSW